jgi:Carboxypeptidase regulatory-like domain
LAFDFILKPHGVFAMARTAFRRLLDRFLLIAFAILLPVSAWGQASVTGRVSGVIADPHSAVVPGATVKLNNSATGESRTLTSTGNGAYDFLNVPIGNYVLTVHKDGFSGATGNVEVTVQNTSVVNFTLNVGAATQSVTVNAATAELLNTTDATLGGLVSGQKAVDLPLNGRSFTDLLSVEPGVTPVISTSGGRTSATRNDGGFAGGTDDFYNDITIDGGDYNDISVPGSLINKALIGTGVPPDAIAEFLIITGAAPAEFGTVAGAHVDVVTKSGTNELHGTLWEFLRNDILDAENYFDTQKLPFKLNQFGAAAGGPIVKDRHFIFGSYEGYRQRLLTTAVPVVPTPYLISHLPSDDAHGHLQQLFNAFYPAPDPGYSPTALVAPLRVSQDQGNDRNSFIIHTDSHLTASDTLSGRIVYNHATGTPGVILSTGLPGGNDGFGFTSVVPQITWTRVINQRMVNEARFTYNRSGLSTTFDTPSSAVTALGYSTSAADANGLPYLTASGTGITSMGILTSIPQARESNVFQYNDTLSLTRGRLTLKTGFNAFRYQVNDSGADTPRAATTFLGFGAPFDTNTTGLTTGDFFQQTQTFNLKPLNSSRRYIRFSLFAGFVANTFQLRKNLTLTYGLRYELNTIPAESRGIQANLYQLSSSGKILPDSPINDITNVTLAQSVNGLPYAQINKAEWQPRIGVAWQPGSGFASWRAAYGIYYERPDLFNFNAGTGNPPFSIPTSLTGEPFGATANPEDFLTTQQNVSAYNPTNVPIQVQNYNANVQMQVEKNGYFQLAYAGSHSTHYNVSTEPNFGGAYPGTRPNGQFQTITLTQDIGNSHYNALQAEFNHRQGNGLTLQISYTFSKSLGLIEPAAVPSDLFDIEADRGRMDSDIRQLFVANMDYQLPIGKGHALADSGIAEKIAGGWSLSSIVSAHSGQPFSVVAGTDTNGDGNATDRATLISGTLASVYQRGRTQFLVPQSQAEKFIAPAGGQLLPRNSFDGPSFFNTDIGVHRTFDITERFKTEFRGEFFNIFNHPNMGNPTNSIISPLFGQILSTAGNSRQLQFALKVLF